VELLKVEGERPTYLDVGARLEPTSDAKQSPAVLWNELVGGIGPRPTSDRPRVDDGADSLPGTGPREKGALASLAGLHLGADPETSGALLRPGRGLLAARIWTRLQALSTAEPGPDPARALAQLRRLADPSGLWRCQETVLPEVARGLRQAAGLEVLEGCRSSLRFGVAVRVPDEVEPATFYAYVRGEHTPIDWLPLRRPLHHAALQERADAARRRSAEHLARWLLVPVGPDFTDEEAAHAVLGVVKAAEYLGVRWRTRPAQAARYSAFLDRLYGPGHDAYRPVFRVDGPACVSTTD
jgi:hypothetical protein